MFTLKTPLPKDGLLDLRSLNFDRSAPVSLGGTWLFEPARLVTSNDFGKAGGIISRMVPDTRLSYPGKSSAGTGSGTYRLTILLPAGTSDLSLRFSTVWTAFELESNGTLLARVGRIGLDKTEARLGTGIVHLTPIDDRLEVLVRVSNSDYRWGGIVQPFSLASQESLKFQQQWDDLLVFVVLGILLGFAANAGFIFAFRRQDTVYLYFALFALIVAVRALTSGDALIYQIVPTLGFDLFVRIQYLSIFLIIPIGALFFDRLFPKDYRRWEMAFFIAPNLAFCLVALFAPMIVLSWSLLPFLIFAGVYIAYGYYIACLRPAFRRRLGANITLFTGTVLLAGVLMSLRSQVLLAHTENAFPYGMALFVLVQSLVMAKRFTWAFNQTEMLTSELKSANQSLMETARSVEESRDMLESALEEKVVLIQEVHHRVKNSLQIITSIINMQARRTQDASALAAYNSMRDRIRALSSVHERLYGIDSEKKINLVDYIQDLIKQFEASYADGGAAFSFESDRIQVSMELCLEIGLVITELVINAYRYAIFPNGGGTIEITLHQAGDLVHIVVMDNGPGFPPEFSLDHVETVGFKIIASLVGQWKGRLSILPGPGGVVGLDIPIKQNLIAAF